MTVPVQAAFHGTVSSSLIALRRSLAHSVYLHAQGPPDRTPYEDCSALLRQLAPAGEPRGSASRG